MAEQGFLLIADISGYTMFLTQSELEHAQGILDALLKSVLAEVKAPLTLSNLQGDAVLAHLPAAKLSQAQYPLDAVERVYCSFSDTLQAMQRNTSCTCNACRNMKVLDLKFLLHYGVYALQNIAGRTELQGPEVIRLHRLLKNTVTKTTGIKAYALVTQAAADAIALPDFFAAAVRHVEHADDFGDTATYVYDLAPIFARWRAGRRVVVTRGEPLCFESMELDLAVPPPVAWGYFNDVEKRNLWQRDGIDNVTMSSLAGGRMAQGSIQHCAHGKSETIHDIVDWRPFDYVTFHIRLPMGAVVRQMAEFTPLPNGGTHLSVRAAIPEANGAFAQFGARMLSKMIAGKLLKQQRAWQAALGKLVADDVAAGKASVATAA
jgi:hypothetical protein